MRVRNGPDDVLTIILAGGQGERLYPLTRDRAKPAVPFAGGYRIIDFTLSNCLNSGLRRVFVLTQYKSLSLDRHIRQGWTLLSEAIGEFIISVPPQQRLGGSWYQGTADAIFQNIYTLERNRPELVLILSGDHVYKMDYRKMLAFHRDREADLTIACVEVGPEEAGALGIAGVDDDRRIRRWEEKPREPVPVPGSGDRFLASMGIYVFDTRVLVRRVSRDAKLRDSDHDFGKDVVPRMIGEGDRVFAWPFEDEGGADRPYWRDIGRVDAYYAANMELLGARPPFRLHEGGWPIRTASRTAPPMKTVGDGEVTGSLAASGTIVAGKVVNSVVGSRVRVAAGAEVRDSILFDEVVVGEGARVRRAILDKRARVRPEAELGHDRAADERRFRVTGEGVVVVPKEAVVE